MQNLREECIQMNHATHFTNICACQITDICSLFNAQKACLKQFELEMAVIIVARGGTAENRERVVEGRGFYPHVFIYLEFQKNTLSEHRFIKSFCNSSYFGTFYIFSSSF